MFGGAPQQDPFDAHVSDVEMAECLRWCNMGRDEVIAAYVAEHTVNASEHRRRFKLQALLHALNLDGFASALPGITISNNIQLDNEGTALGTMPSKPFKVEVMLRHDIATVLEREQARGAELLRTGGHGKVRLKDGHAVRRLFCYGATLDEAIAWRDGLLFAAFGRHASLVVFRVPACVHSAASCLPGCMGAYMSRSRVIHPLRAMRLCLISIIYSQIWMHRVTTC